MEHWTESAGPTLGTFAAALPGHERIADYGAMRRVAPVAWLIDARVIAAALSSALASFLGAPRILQSLARDRIFPWLAPFAHGSSAANNPRRGVVAAARRLPPTPPPSPSFSSWQSIRT